MAMLERIWVEGGRLDIGGLQEAVLDLLRSFVLADNKQLHRHVVEVASFADKLGLQGFRVELTGRVVDHLGSLAATSLSLFYVVRGRQRVRRGWGHDLPTLLADAFEGLRRVYSVPAPVLAPGWDEHVDDYKHLHEAYLWLFVRSTCLNAKSGYRVDCVLLEHDAVRRMIADIPFLERRLREMFGAALIVCAAPMLHLCLFTFDFANTGVV